MPTGSTTGAARYCAAAVRGQRGIVPESDGPCCSTATKDRSGQKIGGSDRLCLGGARNLEAGGARNRGIMQHPGFFFCCGTPATEPPLEEAGGSSSSTSTRTNPHRHIDSYTRVKDEGVTWGWLPGRFPSDPGWTPAQEADRVWWSRRPPPTEDSYDDGTRLGYASEGQ